MWVLPPSGDSEVLLPCDSDMWPLPEVSMEREESVEQYLAVLRPGLEVVGSQSHAPDGPVREAWNEEVMSARKEFI